MGAIGGLSDFFNRVPKEIKEPKAALNAQTLVRLIEAEEIIRNTLDRIPKKIAREYKPGFNRLIALIDSQKKFFENKA